MCCPLRSQNQAVQLTCRTWLRSTSQTSSLWLSRRSWNCRVSAGQVPFNFKLSQYLLICDSPRSPSALLHLPESGFLSSNDLTHTLSSYLKQGERCSKLKSSMSCLLLKTELCFISFFPWFLKFVPSGQRFKSSIQKRVLWFCSSSVALLSEPLSSSSKWHTSGVC